MIHGGIRQLRIRRLIVHIELDKNHAINVYQLIAEETIEQKICELQQVKEDLAEEVLSGEGISSTLFNKDEIMNLLEKINPFIRTKRIEKYIFSAVVLH